MAWQQWVLVTIQALGAIATVTAVGKDRKPLSPGVAAMTVATQGALIWMVTTL